MKHSKNQTGSVLIIELVVLALVAGTGGFTYYRVTQANKNAKVDVGTSVKHTVKPPPPADPTAAWTSYSSVIGKYSLRYKPGWLTKTCSDDPSGLLMLAPDKSSLGICQSDAISQMGIYSQAGDQTRDLLSNRTGVRDIKTEKVTVDGIVGSRIYYVANQVELVPKDTIFITYIFVKGGRSYAATYVQTPARQDLQADFDLMVKNTLEFSS